MKQELVETFIKKMYPHIEFTIISYEKMPKFDFNDSGQFVEGDPAIFIDMQILEMDNKYELTAMIEKFTGFEFRINFI
jgi:hypothetical protein